MHTNRRAGPRVRRTFRATAGCACVAAVIAVPSMAHAASTHSTDDLEFDADGLCAFTVHLTVHIEADTTSQGTAHGSTVIDHVIETDTVAANGVTVQGLPYHYTVHRILDSDGNQVSATAQGETWRFRLPDGGIWSAGGRLDFLTGEQVGSWTVGDDLGPVCTALAG